MGSNSYGGREFETGATRNDDKDKIDYDGFFSPSVLKSFGEYMHKHRKQEDGSMRASDNWQKGIPIAQYYKSLWRHWMDSWTAHRDGKTFEGRELNLDDRIEELNGVLFNTMGIMHELLKLKK